MGKFRAEGQEAPRGKRQEGAMTEGLKGRRVEGQEATRAKRQEGTMTERLKGRRVEGLEVTRAKRQEGAMTGGTQVQECRRAGGYKGEEAGGHNDRETEWQAPGPGIPSMVKNHNMNPVIF